MQSPRNSIRYWNALRAGHAARRNATTSSPAPSAAILGDTFVLEFDARHGFPFRIGGSRVNALFLQELRGVSFLKLWREPDWPEIKSVLRDVADQFAGLAPLRRGAAAGGGRARDRGHAPAALPSRLDSFARPGLPLRRRDAALVRAHRRGRGDFDLGNGARPVVRPTPAAEAQRGSACGKRA